MKLHVPSQIIMNLRLGFSRRSDEKENNKNKNNNNKRRSGAICGKGIEKDERE